MPRATAWETKKEPRRLVSRIRFQSSQVTSSAGFRTLHPALFTRISRWPNAACAADTMLWILWRLRTSSSSDTARKRRLAIDRKSTRLNSSHVKISYAVFCLKKKKNSQLLVTLLLHSYYHHRYLPSFPTRRSSDLGNFQRRFPDIASGVVHEDIEMAKRRLRGGHHALDTLEAADVEFE